MLLNLPRRHLSLLSRQLIDTVPCGKQISISRVRASAQSSIFRMASNEAAKSEIKVEQQAASTSGPTENGSATLVPGPDGTLMSKSAAKKAQKELEKQAHKAAKETLKAQRSENLSAASSGKKEKVKKEVKDEPEWVNNTAPGEKKGKFI